jgi:hypothetical protein
LQADLEILEAQRKELFIRQRGPGKSTRQRGQQARIGSSCRLIHGGLAPVNPLVKADAAKYERIVHEAGIRDRLSRQCIAQ